MSCSNPNCSQCRGSSGNTAATATGAALGFALGGPIGAVIGAALGDSATKGRSPPPGSDMTNNHGKDSNNNRPKCE